MSTDHLPLPDNIDELKPPQPPDSHAPGVSAPAAAEKTRTLFERVGGDARPLDDKARARRERLLSHAERSAHRRRALAELLLSGALADAVAVDPQLRDDVMRLVKFVNGDGGPTDPQPRERANPRP